MNQPTRKVQDFLSNTWTLLILAIFAAIGFVETAFFGNVFVGTLPIHSAATALVCAVIYYSILVRKQNITVRKIPAMIHRINHNYRDALSSLFGEHGAAPDTETRVKAEIRILQSVCQHLAAMFHELIGKPCMVSVKLITKRDGQTYCNTLVRSESVCPRDSAGEDVQFPLNTGANMALDTALRYAPGRKSYFYSGDLTKEKEWTYSNSRQNWKNYYRSEIVCPIRYVKAGANGRPVESDDIGFLIVDTASTNRLKEGFHLELLAACADQMYNFMSLLRGKYSVQPTTPH